MGKEVFITFFEALHRSVKKIWPRMFLLYLKLSTKGSKNNYIQNALKKQSHLERIVNL